MDAQQTTATTTPPLFSTDVTEAQDKAKTTLSSDFETFLRMLTVQMENQDPLNPIDSADYAVQLATFSSVEQQVLTNDLLTALTANMTGGGLAALGQWVGMEVRGAPSAVYDGQPVEVATPTIEEADRRVLAITDADGGIVARIDLDLSASSFEWDGRLANGTEASPGLYSYSVEGYLEGASIATLPATTYARVNEARLDDGNTVLVLDQGVTMPASDVTALREPTLSTP